MKFPLINDEIHIWKASRTGDLLPRKPALHFGTVYNMHISLVNIFICVFLTRSVGTGRDVRNVLVFYTSGQNVIVLMY